MSRAFVKEDEGARWMPPEAPRAYRLVWRGAGSLDVLHETDDLLGALHWLAARERPGFELRDAGGTLLAVLEA